MHEFAVKAVVWAMRLDPATLKWPAAVLVALCFGLVLFGLVQYQAFNRLWGIQLVLGLAGGAVVVGLGASFHWLLGVLYGVGYVLTWLVWVLTRRLRGWRQHLLRGLAAALFLGPWLWIGATECGIIRRLSRVAAEDDARLLLADASFRAFLGLPGLLWMAVLLSGWSWWWARRATSGRSSTARRVGFIALVLVNLFGLNWYVAGRFDVLGACERGRPWTLGYVVFSRPGSTQPIAFRWTTLLHYAACFGHAEVVRFLLATGSDANAKDDNGETPLHWAAANGRGEAVQVLLAAGAVAEAKDKEGRTPLQSAADWARPGAVKPLLSAGARVNARNHAGQTALDVCRSSPLSNSPVGSPENQKAVEDLLLEHGAKTGAELDAEQARPAPEPAQPEPGR